MPLKIWDGASWNAANYLKVWNGASWVECTAGKVWNGSSWVEFFTTYAATLSGGTYTRVASPASFQVNTDGFIYASNGGVQQLVQQYQWKTGGGVSSDYQVYAELTGGFAPTGSALSTWITLSSNAQWNISALAGNFRSGTIDVSIRLTASPNTVLAGPVSVTIECDRS